MKYRAFIFKNYTFDINSMTLSLNYSFDDKLNFNEKYIFKFRPVEYNIKALDSAFRDLFLISGISYYKAYLSETIIIENFKISKLQADFFAKVYQKGLGEFFYINGLEPDQKIIFPYDDQKIPDPIDLKLDTGFLIGIGGGKDSLVVSEALRNTNRKVATWSLNHREKLTALVNRINLNHFYVDRKIDPLLIKLNNQDALNGHIPISAILSFAGIAVAILTNTQDVVVGNEQTANDPTLEYRGTLINHQYSKSQEYENDLIKYLCAVYKDGVRYYSFLRPLSELRIAEIFSNIAFNKYKDVFSSCNRAFHLDSDYLFWCGECPKCAFIFLLLTPFIDKEELVKLWNGKNLLLDKNLASTYFALLGIKGDKPLDCVGEIKESRAAMLLAQKIYPELKDIYKFSLPSDYDYKKLYPDSMPEDLKKIFKSFINHLQTEIE